MLKIEFHVGDDFTATIRKAREIKVKWEKLPPESRRYVMEYGMQRALNDCVGAVKRDDFKSEEAWLDACASTAEKKLDALYAGEIAMRAKAGARDALAEEVRKLTISFLRKVGKIERKAEPTEIMATLARWDASTDAKVVAKRAAIEGEAKEIIALREKATDTEGFDF